MDNSKIQLPEGYDPYDMRLKLKFDAKADRINVIGITRKHPTLLCGAMKNGKPCRQPAGAGTEHPGHGRCRLHGGNNTGPKTAEGKAKVGQNNRIHGLYASTLLPEEQKIFNGLSEVEPTSLEYEINLMRAKIIGYLNRQRRDFEKAAEKSGDEAAYRASKVYYSETENGGRSYYHAATIEDKALDRALNTLRRMVEAHNRLTDPDKQDDLITAINTELRAASQGQVTLSWGGKAQRQGAETPEKDE